MLRWLLLSATLALGQTLPTAESALKEGRPTPGIWPLDDGLTSAANSGNPLPPLETPTIAGPAGAGFVNSSAVEVMVEEPGQRGGTNRARPEGEQTAEAAKAPKRRALPAPFPAPPFPNPEYQGFPLVGVPVDTTRWLLMKAVQGTCYGDALDSHQVRVYGWVNGSANVSTARNSNTVTSYWVAPNDVMLDQAVLRVERQVDTVQTDHVDVGFRSTVDYGIDYRYFTAGGWFSDQLLVHNRLYGVDPTEQYVNVYVPWVAEGMIVTVGRWIACPDIETQFAPDNYMGTHSLQFTVDVYTETGVMATVMLDKQWTVQACIHSGADMAPWYKGAVPTGMLGLRWVSKDNNDSFYTVLNAINNAEFRYFDVHGVPAGHHNYNIIQTTWQHRFNER